MASTNQLKSAAVGRWREIIPAATAIDAAILDGKHHPCPLCGGTDRFRAFDDFEQTGAVLCNQCHSNKNGDGLATIQWANGENFPAAAKRLADQLGMSNGHVRDPIDIVADVARRKKMPPEEFRSFGAEAAVRGKSPVARVPMYGPDGEVCSHFDLGTTTDGLLKGLSAKGKPTGLFIKNGRLSEPGDTVLLTEGVKDAAALAGQGFFAIGLPTNEIKKSFARLFRGCHVVIVPDRDRPGESGGRKTASRLAGVAASVRVATLPGELKATGGDGVREMLAQPDGAELLQQAIADAVEWRPEGEARDPNDRRREVTITTDEHIVNAEVVEALADDETIYQRGGHLVHVVIDAPVDDGIHRPRGTARIVDLPEAQTRDRISATTRFQRDDGDGLSAANPPKWCVQAVHTRGHWPGIRPLTGITTYPVLRRDGTILSKPGYDKATGLLFRPEGPIPEIAENPTRDDALAAMRTLFDIVGEFPFAQAAHQSAWLASLLTPAARHAFSGPAPLFLIDANAAGTGKGLLATTTARILTGREMSVMTNPRSDEECEKRITSFALNGDLMVNLDNINTPLGCASLDAALTADRWRGRILGKNVVIDLPLPVTWFATGNNVVLKGDTSRRVCHIRLNSKVENPEEREGFKYGDLGTHVREHQPELLAAVLTILRAWFVAGKPNGGLKPWGSYEGWSGVVRNAIVWLGQPDPGMTRQELRERSDDSAATLRAMIAGWEELDPHRNGFTCAETLDFIGQSPEKYPVLRNALLEHCAGKDGRMPSTRSLGMKLKHLTGTISGGKYFNCRSAKNTNVWFIESASEDGTNGSSGTKPYPTYADAGAHPHAGEWDGAGNSPTSPTTPADDMDTAAQEYQWIDDGF